MNCNGKNKDYNDAIRHRVQHLEGNLDDVELAKAVVNRIKMIKANNNHIWMFHPLSNSNRGTYEHDNDKEEDVASMNSNPFSEHKGHNDNNIKNKNAEIHGKFKIRKQNHINIAENRDKLKTNDSHNTKKRKRYFDYDNNDHDANENNMLDYEMNSGMFTTYYFLDITDKCMIVKYQSTNENDTKFDIDNKEGNDVESLKKNKVFPICSLRILNTKGFEKFLFLNEEKKEENNGITDEFTLCKDHIVQKECEKQGNVTKSIWIQITFMKWLNHPYYHMKMWNISNFWIH